MVTGKTSITGVFGYPIEHTLSPAFQNAAFRALGLNWIYLPFKVHPNHIAEAVASIRSLGLQGVNVTIPHKQAVIPFLDELDKEAKLLGAVNTISNRKGKLKGYITDGKGFITSLIEEGKFNPKGSSVILLGAGGSGYAIGSALAGYGVKSIKIFNRTYSRAQALYTHIKNTLSFSEVHILDKESFNSIELWQHSDLLINTTSVGMKPEDETLVPISLLRKISFVYDIVYNRTTPLIKAARAANIPCLNGISMLVYQGAASFEIWTGHSAPIPIMRQAVLKALRGEE
ncbi:MAG: shikimate dehydrogenase [Candidatus Ratteibacteria bacterium]|jgi:shikimate dehydrogenase